MFVAPQNLVGKHVLIIEDESLVAFLIEEFLSDFGCIAVGPCSSVSVALEVVRSEAIDVVVLDVNLNGERSYPIADALSKRGIPFLFMSGYGDEAILADHPDWKVCTKPFTENDLATMLSAALREVGSPGLRLLP